MNHKRVYRIYRQENLSLRSKRRKKIIRERCPRPLPVQPNQCWSIDFMIDRSVDGRRLKIMTVVDDCTKECLWIEVARSISAKMVAEILRNIIELNECQFELEQTMGKSL